MKDLFDYNYQINRSLIAKLKKLPLVPDRSHSLLSHIINAHHIWNGRIEGGASVGVWDLQTMDNLDKMNRDNTKKSLSILEKRNLLDLITYTNTKGETYTNSVQDILYHIINHATYHRGQIATDFRNHGVEPLATDYIFFKRNSI